jgi:hypothetical protein
MQHKGLERIKITIEGRSMDFNLAKRLAEDLASSLVSDPMLIAWFDGKKGEEHPRVPECQHKPGWIAYAEGHGGRIRVDVNENEYSFIFADAAIPEE